MARDTYADGKRRCKAAFEEVLRYKPIIDKFREGVSEPFMIRKGDYTIDNLWRIMLLDIHSRSGPRLGACQVEAAKRKFSETIHPGTISKLEPEGQVARVYTGLTQSKCGFGPKITAVFMRQMVCEYEIFPAMKPHLFLHVDTHIQRILCQRLKAFAPREVKNENVLLHAASQKFQDELRDDVYSPRVEMDAFWYVGYLFCSKNSSEVCAEICWIRRFCQSKNIPGKG